MESQDHDLSKKWAIVITHNLILSCHFQCNSSISLIFHQIETQFHSLKSDDNDIFPQTHSCAIYLARNIHVSFILYI